MNLFGIKRLWQHPWSQPVSSEVIDSAKQGKWDIHITKQPLPKAGSSDIQGKNILCLASGGGQQAPILAAAGANVTVYDLSEEQLKQDLFVAQRDSISLKAIQGDMRNLIEIADSSIILFILFQIYMFLILILFGKNLSRASKRRYFNI